MQRIFVFFLGVMCGALLGGLLVTFLTPASGEELRVQSRQFMDKAVADSRQAAEDRRQQLRAELAAKTTAHKTA